MQTLVIPYTTDEAGRNLIAEVRRVFSCGTRMAYANGIDEFHNLFKEIDVRALVKQRLSHERVDAWVLHCAAQEGMDCHRVQRKVAIKARSRESSKIKDKAEREAALAAPITYRSIAFGKRSEHERRRKNLIGPAEIKAARLRPYKCLGDKSFSGNRHFRLALDGRSCSFDMLVDTKKRVDVKVMKRTGEVRTKEVEEYVYQQAVLALPKMRGNAGRLLLQVAALAAAGEINVQFSIDEKNLHVTFKPSDLPDHPERRVLQKAIPGRAVALDNNPEYVGFACVRNVVDPAMLRYCEVLDHGLVDLTDCRGINGMVKREVLAGICDDAIDMCIRTRTDVIYVEAGLGKLRSAGRSKTNNALINGWSRTLLISMLKRKASLCGIRVEEVWGGYSTTIGNIGFALPDACAAAAEIARRGLALDPKSKVKNRSRYTKSTPEEKAAKAAAKAKRDSSGGESPLEEKTRRTLPKFELEYGPQAHEADVRLVALLTDLYQKMEERQEHRRKEMRDVGDEGDEPESYTIENWVDLHREIKEAKIGIRRPHPGRRRTGGYVVLRLTRRNRPGRLLRPLNVAKVKPFVTSGAKPPGLAINPV